MRQTDSHGTLDEDEKWRSTMAFVRSDIDPETVKPIEPRQLASLVNEFLIRSADILNGFCTKFEQRMMDLDIRLDTFERMVSLMERKLENIQVDKGEQTDVAKTVVIKQNMREEQREGEVPTGSTEGQREEQQTKRKEQQMVEERRVDTVRAKDHPKMAKYFRMLKMGVPEAAVKQKMNSEGADSTILGEPDKPMLLTDLENKEQQIRQISSESENDKSLSST